MTSPMGTASRRTARPARNATPSSPRRISPNGGPDQPLPAPPGPNPPPPPNHRHTSPLATKKNPRSRATTSPTRRGNRRPRPRHSGGKGSSSGHHGGRRPRPNPPVGWRWRSHPGPWSGIGEPVADAVDSEQVAGVAGSGLDLLAEVLHVGVDRPLVGLEGDPVDRVQELAAGEDATGLTYHRGQELELGRGE